MMAPPYSKYSFLPLQLRYVMGTNVLRVLKTTTIMLMARHISILWDAQRIIMRYTA